MVCGGEAVLNELHLFAGAGGGILGGEETRQVPTRLLIELLEELK
jgi:hypothetical protein